MPSTERWTPVGAAAILRRISEQTASPPTTTAERLARHWFGLIDQGSFGDLRELVDDDAVYVSKILAGETLVGREAVGDHLVEMLEEKVYEVVAERFVAIDDDRIAVEGRMRWMDDGRVIHDDPVVWAFEFRDGRLLRCVPVRSSLEAETALASRR